MIKTSTHYINSLIDEVDYENQFCFGIYKIYNTINSKIYIGSVIRNKSKTKGHFRARWLYHLSDLSRNKHRNPKLQNFVNKYGVLNLRFSIIEIIDVIDHKYILEREQYYMDLYNAYSQDNFNCSKFSFCLKYNKVNSEEIKEKLRKHFLGKPRPEYLKIILGTPVLQYDFDANFIAEYPSIQKASDATKTQRQDIGKCCLGKLKSANKYMWKYKHSDKVILPYKKYKKL